VLVWVVVIFRFALSITEDDTSTVGRSVVAYSWPMWWSIRYREHRLVTTCVHVVVHCMYSDCAYLRFRLSSLQPRVWTSVPTRAGVTEPLRCAARCERPALTTSQSAVGRLGVSVSRCSRGYLYWRRREAI